MTFFGKNNSSFGNASPNICKNSFFNSPIFFSCETSFTKSMWEVLGKKDAETYSEPCRTCKMENCRNGYQRSAVNKNFKKIHLRYSTEFWMRLWDFQSFMWEKVYNCVTYTYFNIYVNMYVSEQNNLKHEYVNVHR